MTRSKESGIVRLFLLVAILALVTGGIYLARHDTLSVGRLQVRPAAREAARVLHAAEAEVANASTAAKVKAAFALSKRVSASSVDVDSRGGDVTLSGEVSSAEAKRAALSLAGDIAGVETVSDRLSIASEPSPSGEADENPRVRDLEIQVRVYEELLGDDVIDAEAIRVRADNGVVTLTGTVPTDVDERYARAIAGSVPGVESVVSDLVVAGPASLQE